MAALALVLASRGKRVLCVMCNVRDRLSALLGGPPVGEDIVELRNGIQAVNVDPQAALREYGAMVLRIPMLYTAVFESRLVGSLLRATPGLFEWSMLGKAWYHSTELLSNGDNRFDVILFDAPSTGHALEMLRVPKAIVEAAPPGLLLREAKKAWAMLLDPLQSGVILVTLPEELPVTETLEMFDAISNEIKLPVAQIIVNKVIPPILSGKERESLAAFPSSDLSRPENHGIAVGVRRAQRELVQQTALIRLRESLAEKPGISQRQVPISYLSFQFDGVVSIRGVADLSMQLT